MLIKKFETIHICDKIASVIGRRYNVRPELAKNLKPEINGYCYKETVAGLFRAWILNEIHFELIRVINRLQVVTANQIIKVTGIREDNCHSYLEECVRYGLLCENAIIGRESSQVYETLFFIDTGGVFALQEAGIPYNTLPFTSGIDQRINISRANIYTTEIGLTETPKGLIFLEDIVSENIDAGEEVILYDSLIAKELNVSEDVEKQLLNLSRKGFKPYNLHTRQYGIDNLTN